MTPTFAVIPTASRQQALDWSLVLFSQGIESTIESADETAGWRLVVSGEDSQRALQTLRKYRTENRRTAWYQTVPLAGMIFHWRALAWWLLVAVIFLLQQSDGSRLTVAGVMDRQAVWSGQWWRLFTAITLHRDLAHLGSNLAAGILLLGLAMGSFGSGIGLLSAYLAGAAGNLASFLLSTGEHRSLGASGMVLGALGLLSGQMIGFLRGGLPAPSLARRGVLAGLLLLMLFGLNPHSDVVAHIGGFLAGVILGAVVTVWQKELTAIRLINPAAEVLCALLVVLTWWLALS